MAFHHTLNLLINHSLTKKNPIKSVVKFIKWQINSKLNPFPIIYSFTEKSKLIIEKGMTGATGNLYFGLHEFNDMAFLLHFMRKEDFFIDAGANVGSYTVLASSHVGCRTFAFEPIPSTFQHLMNNIYINRINDKVQSFNIGLGSQKGALRFTKSLDTVNHIAIGTETDTIVVPIDTLDSMVNVNIPSLIKIDVEGYETEVLRGASHILNQTELKAIIIELNGSGGRYGYNELEIHNKLLELGFKPYHYNPLLRTLTEVDSFGNYNTIYIRDLDFVNNRVKSAEVIEINKIRF